jgi:hypothetical protein
MVFARVHFFQDILLRSVKTSLYLYDESSVDHRTALASLKLVLLLYSRSSARPDLFCSS